MESANIWHNVSYIGYTIPHSQNCTASTIYIPCLTLECRRFKLQRLNVSGTLDRIAALKGCGLYWLKKIK